jgi:hypothetical protein
MLKIQFPDHPYKIKKDADKEVIFDEVRKKWVRLTPEEWVRQNFLQYLIQVKKIPSSILAIEKEIQLGELRKRCDIVVYKDHQPWMIVECKEMNIPLNDPVLQQIVRYNLAVPVHFLVISNGSYTLAWQRTNHQLMPLQELPDWQ